MAIHLKIQRSGTRTNEKTNQRNARTGPSTFPYAAAILFAKKADGGLRMCIDYRGLNDITIKNRSPIPNIVELRERLKGAKYFSKADLREGFYNLQVVEHDRHKTAFRCRYGHYEFNVVPMGLSNSPGVFQALMNEKFKDLLDICVIVYLDDIVIYSPSKEQHLSDLGKVLAILEKEKFMVKRSKCTFLVKSLEFCGHTVDSHGISISAEKREEMMVMPILKGTRDVRSYLGSVAWFHTFIPKFAEITEPLSRLIRLGAKWEWGHVQIQAVKQLRQAIQMAPTLFFFDSTLDTEVYTDASDFAIGGWIGQRHGGELRPIAYWSRKMTTHELNYAVHEKELLALVSMLDKHNYWLRCVPFTAFTDHESIKYLNSQMELSRRQARWILLLSEYDCTIKYITGGENKLADLLSRSVHVHTLCTNCKDTIGSEAIRAIERDTEERLKLTRKISGKPESIKKKILDCCEEDEFWTLLESQTPAEREVFKNFSKRGGLWFYQFHRIYIPENLRQSILEKYHDLPASGHQGNGLTLELISRRYYWSGLTRDVERWVRSCYKCQTHYPAVKALSGYLQPLSIPEDRFKNVAMDFCHLGQSTLSKNDSALIIVDRLTKFVRLLPCEETITAEQTAKLFIDNWILKGFGPPDTIVSDMGSIFLSKFWTTMCVDMKITHSTATARHQQTDGQSENAVKVVKRILGKLQADGNWETHVASCEHAVNNSLSHSTGFSPYFLVFGSNPREWGMDDIEGDIPFGSRRHSYIDEIRVSMAEAQIQMRDSQRIQKYYYDLRRSRPPEYKAGDQVLLNGEGISWPSTAASKMETQKWIGPMTILSTEGLNCTLQLSDSLRRLKSNIFHVDRLLPYLEPNFYFEDRVTDPRPPPIKSAVGDLYEVGKVHDARVKGGSRRQWVEYLVSWKGYPAEEKDWIAYRQEDQISLNPWTAEELEMLRRFNTEVFVAASRLDSSDSSHKRKTTAVPSTAPRRSVRSRRDR